MCTHVYISFMPATCPENAILPYYNKLKYLMRGLNYEATCYYDVSVLVTFFFLRCTVLKHPQCVLFVYSHKRNMQNKRRLFGRHVIIFVVEQSSAKFAEFWKLDIVELVRCNDVCIVIRGKTNWLFVTSELQPILFQKIVKLSWW